MAQLFYLPTDPVRDANGVLAAGARLTFYRSGTSTLAAVYADIARTVPHPNPLTCDASGRYPPIYMQDLSYRVVIADKNGVPLGAELDPYVPGTAGGMGPPGLNGATASNLTVGLFTGCAGQDLTAGGTKPAPDVVVTSGYRTIGKGGARYAKDAAVDAAFVTAHPGWSFRDSQGNGYRLTEDQELRFEMFGAYGDGATDDYPQWLIAKDFIQFYRETHGNSYYKAVPALHFGRHTYRFSHYLDLTEGAYTLKGSGPSVIDRGGNTFFLMDPGQCGIIFQSWDTVGINGTTTNTAKGAAGSVVEDIAVYGQGGTVGNEEHGFLLKAPATLIRCYAYEMGGYGFLIAADVTHAGNANCGLMIGCGANRCGKSGLGSTGGDSNAWGIFHFNAVFCTEWGIEEQSFLGIHYEDYHTASNGTFASGPTWAPGGARKTAQVNYSGHYYRVRPGQATWCSTNAPSGTTANNQGWLYTGDGGATATYPAWVNGIATVFGGAFLVFGASVKAGVGFGYMESDQSPGYVEAGRSLILAGGYSGWHTAPGTGNVIGANDGRIVITLLGTGGNNGDGIELTPTRVMIGPQCYFDRTSTETFDLRGTLGTTLSMSRNGSGHQHPFSMAFAAGLILGPDSGGMTGIASAMPATGTYTQGAWIRNRTPSISAGKVLLGWMRLTTGSAHVAGTDWTPVYGTTS